MVSKTSILIGQNFKTCAQDLLKKSQITNWQELITAGQVQTARILVTVLGDEGAYKDAIDDIKAFAAEMKVTWRHENYLTYGDPTLETWIPPLK